MCGFSEVPHLLTIIGHVHKVHAAHASMFNNRRHFITVFLLQFIIILMVPIKWFGFLMLLSVVSLENTSFSL